MIYGNDSGKSGNDSAEKPAETGQPKRDTKRMHDAAKQLPQIPSFAPLLEKRADLKTACRQKENAFDEAFDAYLKGLEEHLRGNSERVGKIEGRLDYMDEKELPAIRRALETAVGTTTRLNGELPTLKEKVEKFDREVTDANKLKEKIENLFAEKAEEISKILQNFEDRIQGFGESIRDAQRSAYNAENIAEGLRTIVLETHQPRLQKTAEEVSGLVKELGEVKNSISPASSPGAAEAVKGIPTQPPAAVDLPVLEDESSAEFRVLSKGNNEKLKENAELLNNLKEGVGEALSSLELGPLDEPKAINGVELSGYPGYKNLNRAEQNDLKQVFLKIKELRQLDAMLDSLSDGIKRILKNEEIPVAGKMEPPISTLFEEKDPRTLTIENAYMLGRAVAGKIKHELERQSRNISTLESRMEQFYNKYTAGE